MGNRGKKSNKMPAMVGGVAALAVLIPASIWMLTDSEESPPAALGGTPADSAPPPRLSKSPDGPQEEHTPAGLPSPDGSAARAPKAPRSVPSAPEPKSPPAESVGRTDPSPTTAPESAPTLRGQAIVTTRDVKVLATPSPIGVYVVCNATNNSSETASYHVRIRITGKDGFDVAHTFEFPDLDPGHTGSSGVQFTDIDGAPVPAKPAIEIEDVKRA